MTTVKGCIHLSYDETKYTKDCNVSGLSNEHATWERISPTGAFQLCQFCDQRGRLNSADACTSKKTAQCSNFELGDIEVIFRSKDS